MHLTFKTMSIKVEMQITSKKKEKNIFTPEQSTVRPSALLRSRVTLD